MGQKNLGGPQMIHPGQAQIHGAAGYGRSNYDEPSSIPKPFAVPT